MAVFTHAKKFCEYVFEITKKSPKEYRWNIIDKILKNSLELVEILYDANGVLGNERVRLQRFADTKLKMLGWLFNMAHNMQIFNAKQIEYLGGLIYETRQSLWAWIKSSDKNGV
jgi:hypothetical protein